KPLAANQSGRDARRHHALEYPAGNLALAEAFIAGAREDGVIGDAIFQAQPAKPAIGQIDLDLAANLALRPNSEDVADDQHPDHQHRVNRGPAGRGVVRRKLRMDPGQVEDGADLANQMIVRHHLIETDLVKQLPLVSIEPPHHRPSPSRIARGKRNHPRRRPSTDFCNKICHFRTHAAQQQGVYSITSSARASKVGGTVMPSALAVLRLITSSYLVGCCTGRSAGLAPLSILST